MKKTNIKYYLFFFCVPAIFFLAHRFTVNSSSFDYNCRAMVNNSITLNEQVYTVKAKYNLRPNKNKSITLSINGFIINNGRKHFINRDYLLGYTTSRTGEYMVEHLAFNIHDSDNADDSLLKKIIFPQKNNSVAAIKIFELGDGAILFEDTSEPLFVCARDK